ncbi:MAG: hypothetical protein ACOZNI_21885 [Myxococcota bacterium]
MAQVILLALHAAAATPEEAAQLAELDRLRARVADEVQLSAYDLVDELVLGWKTEPVFAQPTPVVLAGVTVPVGLGTGLAALVENHLAAVLAENPSTNVQLVHCPACTAVVVHSGPDATVISRGIDDPVTIERIGGASGRHALFVDVEAEGTWLVLRARLTRLTPDLPIVWSRAIASSAGTPAMLREPHDLKTAEEARADYLAALRSRGPLTVPLRFAVRTYAEPEDAANVAAPPFIWLQTGVELGASDARAWTASVLAGYSFVPDAYQGLMLQGRVSRLLTGRARSLTHPDLYLFVGTAVFTVWGPATAPFREDVLTADEFLTDLTQDDPRNTLGGVHFGLDLRLGNRIGISSFLETLPARNRAGNFGDYIRVLDIGFQSFGTEVTFCF